MLSTCNMSNIGPLAMQFADAAMGIPLGDSETCSYWTAQAQSEMGNINIYDVRRAASPHVSGGSCGTIAGLTGLIAALLSASVRCTSTYARVAPQT